LGDPLYSERAELLIVKNLYNQKDYVACLNSLSRILPQLRKRSHKRHEIYALSMLGSTYDSLGNHSQALVYLRQALALEEANNLFGGMADFLNFVGTAQMHLGQYDLAIKAYEQALKVGFGYVKSLSIEAIYQNLAYVYMVLKDYEMASRYQEEALFRKERASDLDPYYFSNTLTNAGQIYIDLKDYDKARRYLERALKVNQTIKDPNQRQDADVFALLRLGRLYRSSGDFEGATRILDQCRALPTQDQENRLDVSFDSARTLLALGQYALAREEFDRTIQLFDRNRALLEEERERNFFFTRSKDIYDEMTLLLYNHLGDVEVAFDYSERSKARTFLDLVLGKFRLITEKAKSEMRLFGNARPRHYAEIAAGLPEDVSLLHYAVTREAIIVWLINHGRLLHTTKIPMAADDLQQKVEQFLAGIKQPAPLSQVRAQAQELYTDLIGPLVPFLEPGKTVCIIPDGVLHYLPFAALVSPATGRYLVEDYPISTSPSASIFLRCLELGRQKSLSRSKLLAIGNPSVDPQFKLAPLPFAEREVEQIARYYPMATKLLGSGASEDRVRQAMPQANAIHFATHGLIREREAMYSALMLASGRGNPLSANILEAVHPNSRDGLLKVFELYEVRLLQTSLVVLSACESGLGEFFEGEGIIGLARPFIHAGVPTLVVSLWPISDSSATVDLMARFHQRWQTGYRAATALREAQIRLLSGSQYQHPYYWASFLVMGSGQ
jgi:CHAT domain-containing protein/tetratricopeptide (TPR) repeat protein